MNFGLMTFSSPSSRVKFGLIPLNSASLSFTIMIVEVNVEGTEIMTVGVIRALLVTHKVHVTRRGIGKLPVCRHP